MAKTQKAADAPAQGAHPSYAIAQEMATAKAQHYQAPGVLELPAKKGWAFPTVLDDARNPARSSWRYSGVQAGPDHCPGQLRTVYMRLTVGAVELNGWKQQPGKPTWTAVGVACDACLAFWRSGVQPYQLTASTNGR